MTGHTGAVFTLDVTSAGLQLHSSRLDLRDSSWASYQAPPLLISGSADGQVKFWEAEPRFMVYDAKSGANILTCEHCSFLIVCGCSGNSVDNTVFVVVVVVLLFCILHNHWIQSPWWCCGQGDPTRLTPLTVTSPKNTLEHGGRVRREQSPGKAFLRCVGGLI